MTLTLPEIARYAGALLILFLAPGPGGDPKAILFCIGVLPGCFDLSAVTAPDIVAFCAIPAAVPLCGNLARRVLRRVPGPGASHPDLACGAAEDEFPGRGDADRGGRSQHPDVTRRTNIRIAASH